MSKKKIEDVLLSVPQVRYKKSDGTLYIMKERIVFMLENKNEIAVSHSFYDIKSKLRYFIPLLLTSKLIF
mgnify:CR=1 FL=1